MKRRFTKEQIVGFLREAEAGMPVKELCQRHGCSVASYYSWRNKFGGMSVMAAEQTVNLSREESRHLVRALDAPFQPNASLTKALGRIGQA